MAEGADEGGTEKGRFDMLDFEQPGLGIVEAARRAPVQVHSTTMKGIEMLSPTTAVSLINYWFGPPDFAMMIPTMLPSGFI
jgi:hypothetical protein